MKAKTRQARAHSARGTVLFLNLPTSGETFLLSIKRWGLLFTLIHKDRPSCVFYIKLFFFFIRGGCFFFASFANRASLSLLSSLRSSFHSSILSPLLLYFTSSKRKTSFAFSLFSYIFYIYILLFIYFFFFVLYSSIYHSSPFRFSFSLSLSLFNPFSLISTYSSIHFGIVICEWCFTAKRE